MVGDHMSSGPSNVPGSLRLNIGTVNRSSANNSPTQVKCTCVARLLNEIALLWRKKATYDETSSANFQPQKFSSLFVEHILDSFHCTSKKCNANHDDMLWYVPVAKTNSAMLMGSGQILQVFRRQSKNKPVPGDKHINWEETVCLNIILQQFDYFVTCAVCVKNSHNLQILRKNCQRVYPR